LPPRGVALAEDETELRLFPPLRAGWTVRGRPAPVPISGWNAKRALFGAINLETGHRIFLARGHQRAADCQAFFEAIRRRYPGRHVAVLLDENSSHTAAGSRALADRLGIELLWLPKRSPHLNPMDHLWRHGKEVVSANHQYESVEAQVERFVGYLAGLGRREALRKAGVLSENFRLK
jgi:transposase